MSALSDDEQLDSLKSFAKKYGSAMISGILIALIAFFGWQYWQKKNLAEHQMNTAKVQQLMDDARNAEANPDAFSQLFATADKIVKEAPDSAQAIPLPIIWADYSLLTNRPLAVYTSTIVSGTWLAIAARRTFRNLSTHDRWWRFTSSVTVTNLWSCRYSTQAR